METYEPETYVNLIPAHVNGVSEAQTSKSHQNTNLEVYIKAHNTTLKIHRKQQMKEL